MDYDDLNRKIAELRQRAEATESGDYSWKDVWDQIKSIGAAFKETRYPTRSDKDAAWNRFQEIVDEVKDTQREQYKESERQTESISKRLGQLEDEIDDASKGY